MFTYIALPAGIVFLLLALCNPCLGYDTLIFRSGFESRLVNETINKKNADYLSLFLAINSDSADCQLGQTAMKLFYPSLDAKLARAKTNKQKATTIFKEVHSRFFRKYEENVLFEKIFADGTYNCVTASMLYSIVLDRLGIPYEIKEKPTHIYLVVFPGADNMLFETTNPRGLYMPDEKTKRGYVDGLVAMKLVTQEHVNSVGVSNAFNEFYYDKQNISLQQLAGLQYFNWAVARYMAKDMDAAITSALKANILYPNTKNLFLKSSLIREHLSNSSFNAISDIRHLGELASTSSDVRDRKYVLGVFGDILETKLIQRGDTAFVSQSYAILSSRAVDATLKSEIGFNYQLGMAHWSALKGDMDRALAHAARAYAINPEDARLHDLVARAIAFKSEDIKGEAKAIDHLHDYAKTFPFLKTNKTFKSMMVYQYSFMAYSLFLKNSGDEGYKYLKLLEEDLKTLGGNPVMLQSMIGLAYAEAGAYHYRLKHFYKARDILQKGLTIVPGHGEIEERLRIVNDEL